MDTELTLNEGLTRIAKRNIPVVKIASGYYIGKTDSYLLCKCDGNSTLNECECDCGAKALVCDHCFDQRLILECPKCLSEVNRKWRKIEQSMRKRRAEFLGVTEEELQKMEYEMKSEGGE